jgi:hypothetical protein
MPIEKDDLQLIAPPPKKHKILMLSDHPLT